MKKTVTIPRCPYFYEQEKRHQTYEYENDSFHCFTFNMVVPAEFVNSFGQCEKYERMIPF